MIDFIQKESKTVGESIKALRLSKGITIKELATETGFTPAAVSRWESGKRTPSVEAYKKIMAALGAKLTVVAE